MSTVDHEARKLRVSGSQAHALLWHLIDGFGGQMELRSPPTCDLPSSKYVMCLEMSDGSIEILAQDEKVGVK